jgi:DNA polymerase-4
VPEDPVTEAFLTPAETACNILHVDMDSFFASVEVLDDASLAGKPVIVGGAGARGVVASCTYEARAYGIHSAMSSYEARRRCPHAVFRSGRYARYAQISEHLHEVLSRFTPLIEPIALDEAFLDVSGARRLIGRPREIAGCIRDTVGRELSLSCCVGVARTKLLAKLASRAAKPVARLEGTVPGPGVVVVPPDSELSFLHPLPIKALWGVGPATARRLEGFGVLVVGDLVKIPEQTLHHLLGASNGGRLAALARGDDVRPVEPLRVAKSVGHEETFGADLRNRHDLHRHVVRMADAVGSRLQEAGLHGRTITLKVRYADRSTISRSQTLPKPTDSAHALAAVADALLGAVDVAPGVRLLGVSMSSLGSRGPVGRQLSLTGEDDRRPDPGDRFGWTDDRETEAGGVRQAAWEEVEAAVSQVRARYGQSAVSPAALLGSEGISVKRRGDAPWGPGSPPSTRAGGSRSDASSGSSVSSAGPSRPFRR